MIKLSPPLARATNRRTGVTFDLQSVDDLRKCISQYYAETKVDYSRFGVKGHTGVDIAHPRGTPTFASHKGQVMYIERDINAGYGVVILDESKTFKTYYWHFMAWTVEQGDYVDAGELIGYGDSTGWSTGHHLHWALKMTDSKGNTLNKDNGYNGAIDPMPYLVWDDKMGKLSRDQVHKIFVLTRREIPSEEVLDHWTGKGLNELLNTMIRDDERLLEKEGGVNI